MKHPAQYILDSYKMEDKLTILEEALKFYADEETYFKITKKVRNRPIGEDLGKKAREALEKAAKI